MKAILLIAVSILIAGCEPAPMPIAKEATKNGYSVDKIFEHDGCAMYRFRDEGYYRYFAKCGKQQQVTEEHTETCGKGCTRRIQTTTVQEPA